MENFDTDWNYTSGLSPQAVYTNLRPGSYRLVVYASNEDGYWSQAPAVLEITIRPPVYATRLAWLCYIALTILFLYRWHRPFTAKTTGAPPDRARTQQIL